MKPGPLHAKSKFPLAEGIGILVGVLAWDILLSEVSPDLFKAFLIAAPCALVLYAIRRWRHRSEERLPH